MSVKLASTLAGLRRLVIDSQLPLMTPVPSPQAEPQTGLSNLVVLRRERGEGGAERKGDLPCL